MLAALFEQVLHGPAVEIDLLDFLAGAQALLDDRAVVQVTDRHLDERAEVAGGPVLELGDQVQLVVKLDAHVGTQVGRLHAECSFGGGGRRIARRPNLAGRRRAAVRAPKSWEMHSLARDLRELVESGAVPRVFSKGRRLGTRGLRPGRASGRAGWAGRVGSQWRAGWIENHQERDTPPKKYPQVCEDLGAEGGKRALEVTLRAACGGRVNCRQSPGPSVVSWSSVGKRFRATSLSPP